MRKEPKKICIVPPAVKRMVFDAGRKKGGGSIQIVADETQTEPSNIKQRLKQLYEDFGWGYEIDGDNYKILGKPTKARDIINMLCY